MASNGLNFKDFDGGADRDRTDDLLNAIQALSQLSYNPVHARVRGLTGPLAWGFRGCQYIFLDI